MLFIWVSIIIPLINTDVAGPEYGMNIPEFNELIDGYVSDDANSGYTPEYNYFQDTILWIYLVGCIFFCIRICIKLICILLLFIKHPVVKTNVIGVSYIEGNTIFSIFNRIFIPQNNTHYVKEIIDHEIAHVRNGHTIDLVMTELFIAFQWFNPLVYFFHASIKTVHEFEADAFALNSGTGISSYLRLLLINTGSTEIYGFKSNFKSLTIKKRIQMITKNKTSKLSIIRYFVLIPAIALLLLSFSNKKNEKPDNFPIKEGEYSHISMNFGTNFKHPYTKKDVIHGGIDIVASEGTNIYAPACGRVIISEFREGWGNLVVISHENDYETWYAHLKSLDIKTNTTLNQGDLVGFVGNTGYSTGPHLHYEVKYKGNRINPMDIKD